MSARERKKLKRDGINWCASHEQSSYKIKWVNWFCLNFPTSKNAQVLETDFGSVEDAQTGIPVFLAQTEEPGFSHQQLTAADKNNPWGYMQYLL